MRTSFISVVVLACLVSLTPKGVSSSWCYTCDSHENTNCIDPFKSDGIQRINCSSAVSSCTKTKSTINGVSSFTRSCAPNIANGTACIDHPTLKSVTCYCKSDNCNPASALNMAWGTLLASALMMLLNFLIWIENNGQARSQLLLGGGYMNWWGAQGLGWL